MIFISGIHAVGKGYFCSLVKKELGIEAYSASDLIAKARNASFSSDKLVAEIEENQQYLLAAVQELRESGNDFILDGHFCLINKGTDQPERISLETFTTLKPEAIVLLTEKPEVIVERRKTRDGTDETPDHVEQFQNMEKQYAKEVAELLNAKLFISTGAADTESAIDFLRFL